MGVASINFASLRLSDIILSIMLVLVGRALTVYPLCLIFKRSRWAVAIQHQHIMWWGGLRGALGLALVLALPVTFPYHDKILVITFLNVVFSVIVQGLSMSFLLRWLTLS